MTKLKLSLLENQIQSQGSLILASELAKLQKLKKLSLDFFRFFINSFDILKRLINSNELGDLGVENLSSKLASIKSLKAIKLNLAK